MRLHKNGTPIACVDDWKRLAPPKAANHWVEGRSAFELAHAWCGTGAPTVPSELQLLLESRVETRGVVLDEVLPEHRIPFDAHGGEPRNADLALVGHMADSKIVITIEAKADETFGATVADTVADALERSVSNPRSRGVRRVEDLAQALLPPRAKGLPAVAELRDQLLTAVAGTLAYAVLEKASLAIFVVHEFITDETDDERHARNGADYSRFVHRLAGTPADGANVLIGPFIVPQVSALGQPQLFLGKIVTNRRARQPSGS